MRVRDGVGAGEGRGEHIYLGGFLRGLDESEGLVEGFARAVDAVHRPHDEAGGAHFFRGGGAYLVRAAQHPREHLDALGEDDDAFRAHLPKGVGE